MINQRVLRAARLLLAAGPATLTDVHQAVLAEAKARGEACDMDRNQVKASLTEMVDLKFIERRALEYWMLPKLNEPIRPEPPRPEVSAAGPQIPIREGESKRALAVRVCQEMGVVTARQAKELTGLDLSTALSEGVRQGVLTRRDGLPGDIFARYVPAEEILTPPPPAAEPETVPPVKNEVEDIIAVCSSVGIPMPQRMESFDRARLALVMVERMAELHRENLTALHAMTQLELLDVEADDLAGDIDTDDVHAALAEGQIGDAAHTEELESALDEIRQTCRDAGITDETEDDGGTTTRWSTPAMVKRLAELEPSSSLRGRLAGVLRNPGATWDDIIRLVAELRKERRSLSEQLHDLVLAERARVAALQKAVDIVLGAA